MNVTAESLTGFVSGIFQAAGCNEADARDMAECLVQTNLWGIDSHGVLRTPEYLKRFQSGAMNRQPEIRSLKAGSGLEVLDADNGAGYVAGRAAMTGMVREGARGETSIVIFGALARRVLLASGRSPSW